jgi:hypothetical protein
MFFGEAVERRADVAETYNSFFLELDRGLEIGGKLQLTVLQTCAYPRVSETHAHWLRYPQNRR